MNLPLGISDFRKLITEENSTGTGYVFVDKSLLIKELIDDLTEIIIFTRPRRFGKTLNLSMLQHFFASKVAQEPTKNLFTNLNISQYPQIMAKQGKYPVVFITFKDIKQPTLERFFEKLSLVIAATYREFSTELLSAKLPEYDRNYIAKILAHKEVTHVELEESIQRLLELLTNHYHVKPILLIDEYDTPMQEAFIKGYYDELLTFMRNFFSTTLKDARFLTRAVLTGILRVSKESCFSGLNNVTIYSILNKKYASYFGFTAQEVDTLLTKTNLPINTKQTKEWFNGYNFGGTTIYNPWSIISCIQQQGELKPYWINTSNNELIKDLLVHSPPLTQDKIAHMLLGQSIQELIDEHVVMRNIRNNQTTIWSLFLMSGYLTYSDYTQTDFGTAYSLVIPNKEVEYLYKNIFREWLAGNHDMAWYKALLLSLTEGRIEEFAEKLQEIIIHMTSYYDVYQETFFQGLMLGLVSGLKDGYEIKSNRESGLGRYDLVLIPKDVSNNNKLSILMEFKTAKNRKNVKHLATLALKQIKQSKYVAELKARGIANICCLGIGFSGKTSYVTKE